MHISIVAIVAISFVLHGTWSLPNDELRLYQRLIKYLDPSSRPIINSSHTIVVNVSIVLKKILHLRHGKNSGPQVLQLRTYLEWIDETLHWNPARFGGIQSTTMDAHKIWCPDIYVFNNADIGNAGYLNVTDAKVMIHSNGRISWTLPLMMKSLCAVDVAYFPFDVQQCKIRIGSWSYGEQQLDLRLMHDDVDISDFETNTEFDLSKVTLTRVRMAYDIFETIHPQVVVDLFIKRRPLYYIYTIIIPTLVLCLLTFFAFMLPADSAEKVGIGMTAFLSLYVLQSSVAENIAESSSVPLIVVFLTLVMTLISISLVFATVTINVKKAGDLHPVPSVPRVLLRFCIQHMARFTCAKLIKAETVYGSCDGDIASEQIEIDNDIDLMKTVVTANESFLLRKSGESFRHHSMRQRLHRANHRHDLASRACQDIYSTRFEVSDTDAKLCKSIAQKKKELEARVAESKLEWLFVAQVIDMLLFYIYMVTMVVTITVTLVIVPLSNPALSSKT